MRLLNRLLRRKPLVRLPTNVYHYSPDVVNFALGPACGRKTVGKKDRITNIPALVNCPECRPLTKKLPEDETGIGRQI